ncbi:MULTISPECIES: DsrE family protein [Marinomonas]|uniref:DsrE family protein n=1 Tax=Marinomonas rhodophyticola TaxID=2992803 RepID=A0ABT3KCQ8_9GAMM|nr:DsrE family protein [Marinomonas sp. KJ51-3]MCW4628313.1 DsrE family protein [Marinomonas sp. KJ51-3]
MQSVNVVFHIDEVDKWSLLLANVRNLVKAVDPVSSNITVVSNSKAVLVFGDSASLNYADLIQELVANGVEFVVCQNSLNGAGITDDLLPEYVTVVPVGVLSLIEKQADGFAYIKP